MLARALSIFACAGLAAACASAPDAPPAAVAAPVAAEVPVRLLPLEGGAADAEEEISGLAWRGDHLVLLPEYCGLREDPARDRYLLPGPQHVWVLERRAITDHLDGLAPGPLAPRAVPVTPDLRDWLPGVLDGFEAIAFDGDTAYLLVETYLADGGKNPAWILRGTLAPDLSGLHLDLASARPFPRPTAHKNASFEALFLADGHLHALYELNAPALVARPEAARFTLDLAPAPPVPMAPLAWRVTDATPPDAAGHLWVLNYRFPKSDKSGLEPTDEPLARRFGAGPTHARFGQVERLVELALGPEGLRLTDRAPIQLALPAPWQEDGARNWEGIAPLPGRGFLLVTDRFPTPTTLLGFVPAPGAAP